MYRKIEVNAWQVEVLCNDCFAKGKTPFHVLGLKCPNKDVRKLSASHPTLLMFCSAAATTPGGCETSDTVGVPLWAPAGIAAVAGTLN